MWPINFFLLSFLKDQNVKLIRELKNEIDTLKKTAVSLNLLRLWFELNIHSLYLFLFSTSWNFSTTNQQTEYTSLLCSISHTTKKNIYFNLLDSNSRCFIKSELLVCIKCVYNSFFCWCFYIAKDYLVIGDGRCALVTRTIVAKAIVAKV